MGSSASIAWEADQDSVCGQDGKVILSAPIEGMTAEDFFKALENYIRNRPINPGSFEVSRELKTLDDGGIHEIMHIEVTGVAAMVAGDMKVQFHNLYKFQPDKGLFQFDFYHMDETLKDVSNRTVFKVVNDPFRLEVTNDEFETRKAGPLLQNIVKGRLLKMGFDVDVAYEAPSISTPGKKSILSSEIKDDSLDLKAFWAKLSEQLEEVDGGTSLPDGSVVVEQSNSGGILGATYHKYYLDEENSCVTCMDFGPDETMNDVRIISYWKMVDSPKRLEVWANTVPGRRTNDAAMKVVRDMVENAMKFNEESA